MATERCESPCYHISIDNRYKARHKALHALHKALLRNAAGAMPGRSLDTMPGAAK